MAIPTQVITTLVKGIVGIFKKLAIPLASFFAGKGYQEKEQLQEEMKNARKQAKLRDAMRRANNRQLDDILHD